MIARTAGAEAADRLCTSRVWLSLCMRIVRAISTIELEGSVGLDHMIVGFFSFDAAECRWPVSKTFVIAEIIQCGTML